MNKINTVIVTLILVVLCNAFFLTDAAAAQVSSVTPETLDAVAEIKEQRDEQRKIRKKIKKQRTRSKKVSALKHKRSSGKRTRSYRSIRRQKTIAVTSVQLEPRTIGVDAAGYYHTRDGDMLKGIAQHSLALRGKPTDSESIYKEMSRIALFNARHYPELFDPDTRLTANLRLRILILEDGVDLTDCGWLGAQWKEATPNEVTIAAKCDRVQAAPGARVIAHPGSEVILSAGARAFAFQGALVTALEDSVVMTVGGRVRAHPGSNVRVIAPSEIMPSVLLENYGGTDVTNGS